MAQSASALAMPRSSSASRATSGLMDAVSKRTLPDPTTDRRWASAMVRTRSRWVSSSSATENAPLAVRTVKAAVLKGLDMPLDQGIRLEADLSSLISTSEDAKEGPKACAEKRAPVWKGR